MARVTQVVVFLGVGVVGVTLVHFYLWRRLVRSTTRTRLGRRIGGGVLLGLGLLVLLTLVGSRVLPHDVAVVLSWPGYLWIAVMFYLLMTLAVLELPALLGRFLLRPRAVREVEAPVPALVGAGQPSGDVGGRGVEESAPARGVSPIPKDGARANDADEPRAMPADGVGASRSARASDVGVPYAGWADGVGGSSAVRVSDQGASLVVQADDVDASSPDPAHVRTVRLAARANDGGVPPVVPGNDDPASSVARAHGTTEQGIGRRLVLARAVAITAGLASVGIVGSGVRSALGPPQLKRVQIPLAKLARGADGFRIALVSDIHLGPLRGFSHTQRIVDLINGLDADIVTIVGDLVDGSVAELGVAASPLRRLHSRYGSFFVTGNHEYFSGYTEWIDEVARLGVRPLRNEWSEIPGGIDLAGVNDVTGASYDDAPDFDKALAGRDPERPVVMLAHQPIQAEDASARGVDLQLSGHTHGGQMVPFNLVVRAAQQPVVSGLGEVGGMPVYVTNGAGFWGPPVRVGAPPDITLIELRTP